MPFVLTADQKGSRRTGDRVPRALDLLVQVPVVRGFERTAGDEFQGVLNDARAVVDAVLLLVRDGAWSIGVGFGPVESPLPRTTRAGRGPAFQAARSAVEAAKLRPQPVAVHAPDAAGGPDLADEASDAESVLTLLTAVLDRRTAPGWEAVDALAEAGTITAAAAVLGISRQAVGQRLSTAQWQAETAGRATAARLLLRCLDDNQQDAAS